MVEQDKESFELINSKLEEVNKLIAPYKLAYIDPRECELLERNAHYMEKGMLEQLASNIKEDGFLSQLPFALKKDDGKFRILSGNHRVKASIKANQKYILILYVENIPKDKQIAYQLSHNSLVGKDDMAMLKEIFQEIESLKYKEYTGLNDLKFIDYEKINIPSINEDDIELYEMKFIFTKAKAFQLDAVIKALNEMEAQENTRFILGDFKEFIRMLTELKKSCKIKSNSVAFIKMLSICEDYLKEKEAETETKK